MILKVRRDNILEDAFKEARKDDFEPDRRIKVCEVRPLSVVHCILAP